VLAQVVVRDCKVAGGAKGVQLGGSTHAFLCPPWPQCRFWQVRLQ
jgi:hypothetical protein